MCANLTDHGEILLSIARAAISRALGCPLQVREDAPWLFEHGACFVTLSQGSQLRGCIGSLQAHRTLLDDVKGNAYAAAFRDPRFAPLALAELAYTEIEISLLSPSRAMRFSGAADALSQLRPGIDGVILEFGSHRSTFLPQVWENLPHPADFISHLKVKAGLPPDFWSDGIKLSRYTVTHWKEHDFHPNSGIANQPTEQ